METDGVLIERSARGRPDAFVEVVRRHEVAVHAFLARRAGPQAALVPGIPPGTARRRLHRARSALRPVLA